MARRGLGAVGSLLGWPRAPARGSDTQLGDEPRELQQRVEAVEHSHVAEANLLDEIKLDLLINVGEFANAEERAARTAGGAREREQRAQPEPLIGRPWFAWLAREGRLGRLPDDV